MEAFMDPKISKYLMRVSSEYFTSSVLPSLTSTAGQTSRVLLAYVIPWLNKTTIYSMQRAMPEFLKLYCAVEFVSVVDASKLARVGFKLHLCN